MVGAMSRIEHKCGVNTETPSVLPKSLRSVCFCKSPCRSCSPGPHHFYWCSSRHTGLRASACLFLLWALLEEKTTVHSSVC